VRVRGLGLVSRLFTSSNGLGGYCLRLPYSDPFPARWFLLVPVVDDGTAPCVSISLVGGGTMNKREQNDVAMILLDYNRGQTGGGVWLAALPPYIPDRLFLSF
jgi:hypothetical protein